MIQQELNNISTYVVGDFIIKVIDAHNVRITTDRGTVLVCPRSDNSIIVKSSKVIKKGILWKCQYHAVNAENG